MHHGYRTKIREILQNAYFVIPKPEAFQEGLSTVNQILQELETGGYARGQDFVEAKSAAVCAKIILSEVLNEMMLNSFYVDDLIKRAIQEDINYLDVTSDYLLPPEQTGAAKFVAKASGVLCGLDVAFRVFQLLDPTFSAKAYQSDGDPVEKGDLIAEFTGNARQLLKGERTALNLLQHMSGIATATAQAVALTKGTKASIADTRKTLPGLRALQKYAVTIGGGKTTALTSPTPPC